MSKAEIEKKIIIFNSVVVLLFLLVGFGFYRLQISRSSFYFRKSLENSVKMITQMPVRGNIYDRNGKLLAGNRPAFSLYLVPNSTTSRTIHIVSGLSGRTEKEIRKQIRHSGRFQPVKIMRQVDLRTLTWIQENILDLPGVELKTEPRRYYTRSSGIAHLLGTLGEVGESEIDKHDDLEPGDVVGKKAVEKAYDQSLRGSKGVKFVKVDALGREVEDLPGKRNLLPYPGKQLYLTIDLRLQSYADSLMESRRGALVALDTRTGEVLTMVSKPDYDPAYFAGIIPTDVWNSLINNPYHPLYDRASQSGYPPGSVFKLIAAIAALNEKIITPAWKANCPGYFKLGRRTIRCWNAKGHGTLDLIGAIKNSCNVYFYKLGLLIGIDAWTKYSRLFHFGEKTGIELTNENSGLVPSREYYDKKYGKNRWTRGMLANLAIGQGELLVTPVQIAQFVATIANQGVMHRPHLGLKLYDPIKKKWQRIPGREERIEGIDSSVYKIVREGMREVVDGGTGWRAKVWRISGGGKTGTAQNPHGKSHAWYMGFAPFEEPEIAICVLVENGGSGGGVAAPIAGAFLRKYFYLKGKYDYRAERKWRAMIAKRDSLRKAAEADSASLPVEVPLDE